MNKRAQALLLEALPSIQRSARYVAAASRSSRFDADDLAQIGCLAVCEAYKKKIHPRGNKRAYLLVIARRAMQRHCGVYRSLIKAPRKANGYQPALLVLSLDAPIWADDEVALLDRLADEAVDAADEYVAIYDASLDGQPSTSGGAGHLAWLLFSIARKRL